MAQASASASVVPETPEEQEFDQVPDSDSNSEAQLVIDESTPDPGQQDVESEEDDPITPAQKVVSKNVDPTPPPKSDKASATPSPSGLGGSRSKSLHALPSGTEETHKAF